MIDGIIIHHLLSWISEFLFSEHDPVPKSQLSGRIFRNFLFLKASVFLWNIAGKEDQKSLKKRRFSQGFMPFMNILERLDKKETKACVLYFHRLK